jgi:hypothetical protein
VFPNAFGAEMPSDELAIFDAYGDTQPLCYAQVSDYLFGYPEDTVYEIVDKTSGEAHPLPELVYVEGHVRRRVNNDSLPNLKVV